MKKLIRLFSAMLAVCLLLAGCGATETKSGKDTSSVAHDYYIDLTDLGMKLTIYLRLDAEGNFLFSNTLDFETNKSSGTFQESDGSYIMVYSSVNGEEKTASDGLTSTFTVQEDGSLDFTSCDYIYYGSARATTTSADNPDAKLIGHIVTEDYDAPDLSSPFESGTYETADVTEGGITYTHSLSFYEDNTYLHVIRWEENGQPGFSYETGTYGISTTQLALEPGGEDRLSCEVVDGETLNVSVYPYAGAEERETLEFEKSGDASVIAELGGTGEDKEGASFEVTVTIWSDGSFSSTAGDFTETGILALSTADGYAKQYPDHPETGVRGLNQVATVPNASCTFEDGKLTLSGLRVRKSSGLARYECTVTAS